MFQINSSHVRLASKQRNRYESKLPISQVWREVTCTNRDSCAVVMKNNLDLLGIPYFSPSRAPNDKLSPVKQALPGRTLCRTLQGSLTYLFKAFKIMQCFRNVGCRCRILHLGRRVRFPQKGHLFIIGSEHW